MHYYQFCIGDYAKDCRHLSWDEDLAYRRLLDTYYAKEEPLPLERRSIYRLVGAQTDSQREAVDAVLGEFFVQTEDGWRNQRADSVIQQFHDKSEKASRSAHIRWEGKASEKPSQSKRNANASLDKCERMDYECEGNANHKPLTSNQKPSKNKATKVVAPDGVSVLVWADFLTLRRSKKLPVTETALKGIEREALKARLTMDQAIRICCERGWGSFKADWIKDKKPQLTGQQSAWLTITGQTANFEEPNHGRTIEADPLPPALLG